MAPPTTVNNKPLIKGSAAERWADRIIKNARGNMNMGIDPVVQTAYTIKGAALIESGLRTFAEWSQHMVKEFGETIRPHLEGLWQRSEEHLTKTSKTNNFEEGRHLRPTGPFDINRKPRGPLKVLPKKDKDAGSKRGCDGENEAAVVLRKMDMTTTKSPGQRA